MTSLVVALSANALGPVVGIMAPVVACLPCPVWRPPELVTQARCHVEDVFSDTNDGFSDLLGTGYNFLAYLLIPDLT